MLECFSFTTANNDSVDTTVRLTYEQRQKSRAQAKTESGDTIGWFVERGHVLADGDVLLAESGEHIGIIAAPETLSEARTEDELLLARAAYHLGNRHVPLQIARGVLHYQHDHVLDAMLEGLGLTPVCVEKPFHPESGAYHSHAHSHD